MDEVSIPPAAVSIYYQHESWIVDSAAPSDGLDRAYPTDSLCAVIGRANAVSIASAYGWPARAIERSIRLFRIVPERAGARL